MEKGPRNALPHYLLIACFCWGMRAPPFKRLALCCNYLSGHNLITRKTSEEEQGRHLHKTAHCLLGRETVEGLAATLFLAQKFLDAFTDAAAVNLSTPLAASKNPHFFGDQHRVPLPPSFAPMEASGLLILLHLPHPVGICNYNMALLPRGKKVYQPL